MAISVENRKIITLTARTLNQLSDTEQMAVSPTTRAIKANSGLRGWDFAKARLRAVDIGDDAFVSQIQDGEGPRAPDFFAKALVGVLTIPNRVKILKDYLGREFED